MSNQQRPEDFNPDAFAEQALTVPAAKSYDLGGDIEQNKLFCSFVPKTDDEKATLYGMMATPDARIDDMLGKTIEVVHVLQHTVYLPDPVTGELEPAPRVVLLDKDGKSYVGVSMGVYSSVRTMMQVYGKPPFNPPIKVEPFKQDVAKGKMTSLRIVRGK